MRAHIPIVTLVLLLTPVVVPGLTAATANGDTIYVCWDGTGDYVTIQEGIDAAVDGDEVVVCDGTYTGEGNRDLDFHGKAITVRSANGSENCIIDCQGTPEDPHRGFYFHSAETAASVLDGFTITNGCAPDGGGLYFWGSGPTITHCTIARNSAGGGGGGYCYQGNPTFIECTITENLASYDGGALLSEYSTALAISNCVMTGNVADDEGGALWILDGAMTLADCLLDANRARRGGAIASIDGTVAVTNCTVEGNSVSTEGAGILSSGFLSVSRSQFDSNVVESDGSGGAIYHTSIYEELVVRSCSFTANTAGRGGAIRCGGADSTPVTVADCVFLDNSALNTGGALDLGRGAIYVTSCVLTGNTAAYGGAVRAARSVPTLVNCVFAENGADGGGGIYSVNFSYPVLINCTFTRNEALGGAALNVDSIPTFTNCILWGDAGGEILGDVALVSYSCVEGGYFGRRVIADDPLFVDPASGDYRLWNGSPCIDAGCNGAVPLDAADLDDDDDTSEVTPLDLDGEGRFFDDSDTPDAGCGFSAVVDMGAYEFGDTGPQPCPGDIDGDRDVDQSDLGILLSLWGASDECDLDCDGDIDQGDLGILLTHWGEGCP